MTYKLRLYEYVYRFDDGYSASQIAVSRLRADDKMRATAPSRLKELGMTVLRLACKVGIDYEDHIVMGSDLRTLVS